MKTEMIYKIILSVLSGEATEAEKQHLDEWLSQSEIHQNEYEQIVRLYHHLTVTDLRKKPVYEVEKAWQKVFMQTIHKRKSFRLYQSLSYAASILILLGLFLYGLYYFRMPEDQLLSSESHMTYEQPTLLLANGESVALKRDSFFLQQENIVIRNNSINLLSYESDHEIASDEKKIEWNRLVVPKGNTYEVQLSDGTHVWLNAQSELSYPTLFSGKERTVTLKGEAFFKVAPDVETPFYVKVEGLEVKVLGTSFNVSAYHTESISHVTLVEGSVAVKAESEKISRIVPSEQFYYDRQRKESSIQVVNTDLYTSWIRGEYIFQEATLDEIFQELSHWYNFTVQYQEEDLKQERFSLTVDRSIQIEQLLELMSFTSGVKFEMTGDSCINVKKEREVQ